MRQSTAVDEIARLEAGGNRLTQPLGDLYAGHRERATAALLDAAPGGRLCLLGAGNANDLDLESLAGRFEQIHLVDLDPAALARARGRQSATTRSRLHDHAPVDLSGLYHQLDRPRLPSADALVTSGAAQVLRQLPAGFDVSNTLFAVSQTGAPTFVLLLTGKSGVSRTARLVRR